MRYSAILLLLSLGCESAPLSSPTAIECRGEVTPRDLAYCFDGVSLPVIRETDAGRVPAYCFELHENEDRILTDPYAPAECFGSAIPPYDDERVNDRADWMPYTTMRYVNVEEDDVAYDYIAQRNVMRYAEQYLWPVTRDYLGSYGRAPCGGEATCYGDLLRAQVSCYVSVTDCRFEPPHYDALVLRTYHFTCSGITACDFENKTPEECCTPV